MLSRWAIRNKLLLGVAMVCLIVVILSVSSLRGVYAYRRLVRSLSRRADEMPAAATFTATVGELRFAHRQVVQPLVEFSSVSDRDSALVKSFDLRLVDVGAALDSYKNTLNQGDLTDKFIGDRRREWETVREIEHCLERVAQRNRDHQWILDSAGDNALNEDLEQLSALSLDLPKFLQTKMQTLRDEVRGQYRTWLAVTWVAAGLTVAILVLLVYCFWRWVFEPIEVLVAGARRVASGEFGHRIQVTSADEMAELAEAMNASIDRFQEIRDQLDQQVQERTKEVVRSEQLASVGFLAAGVAHEINNPLASVAWSAESLESRLHEILAFETIDEDRKAEIDGMKRYLRRIQDEAFRCKGITERLLDFSRMGDIERQETDVRELVESVIEMVKHLGKYRNKQINFLCDEHVVLSVNAQEIKQVVLNLITNALDSLDDCGVVDVQLSSKRDSVVLSVKDNGCGMSEDVIEHIFEPFYTRRRDGQGTGLGLSITYRIVSDHGGKITAESDGPGTGSLFTVEFLLSHHEEKNDRQQRAA